MLHDVLEFADVAGVGVLGKRVLCGGFHVVDVLAVRFLVFQNEILYERRDKRLAFPQRRKREVEGVEPVVEVFAEYAFFHGGLQVAVGRRDDANVHVPGLGFAYAAYFVVLQKAQQLHLGRRGKFAHFVEEERSAVRGFEQALLVDGRTRIGSLLRAEEFAFDQVLGNGPAVHGYERFACALAVAVDDVCEKFLARSGFAGNEHRAGRGRNLVGRLENLSHFGRVAKQTVQHLGFHQLVGRLVLAEGLDLLGRVFELAYARGLHQKAVCPAVDGARGAGPVLAVAEYENLDAGLAFLQVAHHVHVVEREKRDFDKGEVYGLGLYQRHQIVLVVTENQFCVGQCP